MKTAAAALIVVSIAAAALLAGCGGGGSSSSTAPVGGGTGTQGGAPPAEGAPKKATAPNAPAGSEVVACEESSATVSALRATVVDCGTARTTVAAWTKSSACALGAGESRGSCSLGGFRCQSLRAEEGVVVSCARPDATVAFIARPTD